MLQVTSHKLYDEQKLKVTEILLGTSFETYCVPLKTLACAVNTQYNIAVPRFQTVNTL